MKIVLLAALLALLTSCAGGSGEGTTTDVPAQPGTTTLADPATTTSGADTSTTSHDGPTAEITISGFSFGSNQTVAVGTRVTATNRDPFGHTWTSVDQLWDSGTLSEGESFSFTFDETGTFSFFCKIHSTEMGGSIVIEG
ncbi:MAG: plastocyanin/azurin family copper-binding protein [Acidimicrobiia bacterium]